MRVAELWRFPVKSLQGEQLDDVTIGPHGIVGDRGYALFDAETGFGLTARRAPELLFASGRLRDDGSAAITLPDGSIADDDEALSSWLGRSVLLRSTSDDVTRRYENPVDPEHEELSRWGAVRRLSRRLSRRAGRVDLAGVLGDDRRLADTSVPDQRRPRRGGRPGRHRDLAARPTGGSGRRPARRRHGDGALRDGHSAAGRRHRPRPRRTARHPPRTARAPRGGRHSRPAGAGAGG